ncbi:hypothetical protein KQX54_001235 [Cotesia glomerata]|uniref:Uncharacterized protein n=1 Tax=Cotesia glomerata TaxID=32391 RepID=A0AAV7ISX7_COTGL|nr:hypothetical protein KQX54_001235 [Cotesia glomerata]
MTMKRMTLSTEPCGNPLMETRLERVPLILTFMLRWVRKLVIKAIRLPENPSDIIISITLGVHVLSYAFSMSKDTMRSECFCQEVGSFLGVVNYFAIRIRDGRCVMGRMLTRNTSDFVPYSC